MITRYKKTKDKRVAGVRARLAKTKRAYRLIVVKSNKYVYAQMLKIATGETMFGIRTKDAKEAGVLMAQKAKAAKITEVVLDRGSNKYHGKVKLFADAAREGGLKF